MRRRFASFCAVCTVLVAACSGADPTGPPDPSLQAATLTVSPDSVLLGGVGLQQYMTAVARNAAGQIVPATPEWHVSDNLVAMISECGIVLAVSEGTATITARVGIATDSAFVRVAVPESTEVSGSFR